MYFLGRSSPLRADFDSRFKPTSAAVWERQQKGEEKRTHEKKKEDRPKNMDMLNLA